MKINGSLVFDESGLSQIENLRVEKVSSLPTWGSADVGRLVYVTGSQVIWLGGASSWIALATGGNAAALQTEVDAVEVSLGVAVNSDGTFNAAGFQGVPGGSPTSFTDAINKLAAYATGKDTLAELGDVALTSPAAGQFLEYNGTNWVNHTLETTDINGVTASASELNILDGATLSTAELNFVDGVTSPIQDQLDDLQAGDPGLNSLAALTDLGIVVQSDVDTFSARTLVAPTAGFTITNPGGVAGNPTFVLANDLAALEGLTSTGYVVRTGDGTATTRAFTGVAGNTVVTNGSGVASDTTIDLAAITQAATGTFSKVTLDGFGRVTGNTPVVAADITSLVDSEYVNAGGDTMTGNLTMSGGATITGLPAPTSDTQAANKAYVDALQNGLSWKKAVRVATTGNINLASAASGYDGVTLANGDRVLVKDQTAPAENGIYVFNGAGAALTRASDMDAAAEFDGSAVFVAEGTSQQGSGWTETATVATVGTDAVAFSQFTGGALYTWGDGLSNSGNTININLGAGIAQLPTDEVGIDLYDDTNGALLLTTDGLTQSTATGSKLYLKLSPTGGIVQTSADGLKIAASGVTNAMLQNSSVGLNGDAGTSTLALGQTLQIIGTSAQGISSSVAGQTVTLTAADASSSQKGVASFSADDFTVTTGAVTIKTVDNNQLAFSTITFVGDAGSDAVALGESLTVQGDGAAISTAVTANNLKVSARDATDTLKGVASFAAADFTVTDGEVTAVAKGLDSLTDVAVTSASTGDTLVYNGTNFANRKIYFLYTGTSNAVHTVTHSLGQKYCNVTVVDDSDNVVIPESIVFTSSTALTVTFNTAIACKVIVMGI